MTASILWYFRLQVYHETSTLKFEWKFPVVIFAELYKIWDSLKWRTSPPTYPWGEGWGGGGRGGSSLKGATFFSYKTSFKLNLLGGLISFPGQLFSRNATLLSLVSLLCLLRLNVIEGSAWNMQSGKDEQQLSLDTVSILFYRKC